MRIVVGGSRTFTDYPLLKKTLDKLTKNLLEIIVISGHAIGADRLGERWCEEKAKEARLSKEKQLTISYEVFHADWEKHGKVAGPIRNQEVIDSGVGGAVFFWDGRSKGTKDMIGKCKKAKVKRIKIVRFDNDG